ncbi:hypothetical protein Bca52824_009424 [Brassica carinata]|uniref:Cysteine/Histidine-rich C1 domain family protein n=1 Tax=Brassica carinata TaxID=52824 RepID=A0A8X7WBT6_BRACI|nr:hypothetical protein Bca52824_009424 [Brassica carinata]
MDVAGEFHRIEKDGKLYFEYHHSKYHPIPQIQSSSSSKTIISSHAFQSLFVCPAARCRVALRDSSDRSTFSPIFSSPEYLFSTRDHDLYHSVLPLFWCNNKDFAIDGGCDVCNGSKSGTDYYLSHKDCMYFPRIIKISRHPHRISYKSSLRSGEWLCGVCRQNIEIDYGAYSCDKCCDYAVHSICATGKNVWDGEDLEGVPEEDDITLGAESFEVISEGVILHFLHNHHLYLQVSTLYDENKFCQACVLPIFEGNIYSCIECGFILHETCAQSRRKLQHALHPHPLTLRHVNPYEYVGFTCDACDHYCGGFIYGCHLKDECDFDLDIRCASISEPVDYQGHEHPLYLALNPEEKPICHVCKTKCEKQLNCIICNFIICVKCTTLPYKVKYKHDKHFLRVLWGEEICDKSWCEVCENDMKHTNKNVMYWCDECCITVHVECLFGDHPYLKHGQFCKENGIMLQIIWKSNTSRPSCNYCKNRCQHKMFMRDDIVACSMRCALSNS